MNHIGTTCTHCADGCKTTLGVRRSDTGMDIVRGDNRDKSGINGDFLCIKGRYGFDFADNPERIKQPLIRKNGQLTPSTWEEAFELIGRQFKEICDKEGGRAIGVVGSNRTTNEENYLLQKFARVVLGTNNIDHHRTADFPALAAALSHFSQNRRETGHADSVTLTASMREVFNAPAMLLIGNDPTNQHPLLAWQIRNNVRLHRARLYVVNSQEIKLKRQSLSFTQIPAESEAQLAAFLAGEDAAVADPATRDSWSALREKLRGEKGLVVIFGSEIRGKAVESMVKFVSGIEGAKLVCLGDYANSHGAADMGLYPDLLPGYHRAADTGKFHAEWGGVPSEPGLTLPQMVEAAAAGNLKGFYVVGANPVGRMQIDPFAFSKSFVVVQDMFLTETAAVADVVLPAANAYEKAGSFTNTCGDLQILKMAGEVTGTKTDFEMIVRISDAMGFDVHKLVPFGRGVRMDMGQSRGAQSGEADRHAVWLEAHGLESKMSPFDPMAILDEIQRLVPGYDVSRANLAAGNDQHTDMAASGPGAIHDPGLIAPANNTLFTSGTLGRFCDSLNAVMENPEGWAAEADVAAD
jgi:NADH-quinone oxidoreductase subunit G